MGGKMSEHYCGFWLLYLDVFTHICFLCFLSLLSNPEKKSYKNILKSSLIWVKSPSNNAFTQLNTFWAAFRTRHRICVYGL
jgi:hypothetical protein